MKTPPIKKECSECGGTHKIIIERPFQDDIVRPCVACSNLKDEWNYLTPEQYVNWMRTEGGQPDYEMLDSDPIWKLYGNREEGKHWGLCTLSCSFEKSIKVVAMQRQPNPPEDYRP